jgi:hypothetical protein
VEKQREKNLTAKGRSNLRFAACKGKKDNYLLTLKLDAESCSLTIPPSLVRLCVLEPKVRRTFGSFVVDFLSCCVVAYISIFSSSGVPGVVPDV